MEDIEYSNSLYQVSEILKYLKPNLEARIPLKYKSYFENNKSKEFEWNIDKSIPLEKQDLLPTAKEILTFLYMNCICDEEEKMSLQKTLNENEIQYQNELKEKYNPDNIFKNKQVNTTAEIVKEKDVSIAEYKESLITRIIKKIKLFFS